MDDAILWINHYPVDSVGFLLTLIHWSNLSSVQVMNAHSKAYTNSTSTKRQVKMKTVESQMKERGSGQKTTSNEFMEPVLTWKLARK